MKFNNIIDLYNKMNTNKKLSHEFCIIFVFNDYTNYTTDELHKSECITSYELATISNSFRSLTNNFYEFSSEDSFIKSIPNLKSKHKYILVYSMAQNTNGIGRRCLIPLICQYYNLYNISADFYSSVLGGNKELMHKSLFVNKDLHLPKTLFYNGKSDEENITYFIDNKIDFIIKPNSESASIGVSKINVKQASKESIFTEVLNAYNYFGKVILQEFIYGKEVEVSILKYSNEYYIPDPVEIVFKGYKDYLDYDTIASEFYDFKIYNGKHKSQIISASKSCAKMLNFEAISRIDFRVTEDSYYIFDITPNPTISEFSSTNYAFRKYFMNDPESVYKLLIFNTITKNQLFKPPFNTSI